jgi:hypothetical protein
MGYSVPRGQIRPFSARIRRNISFAGPSSAARRRDQGGFDRKYPVRLNYAQLPSVRDLC